MSTSEQLKKAFITYFPQKKIMGMPNERKNQKLVFHRENSRSVHDMDRLLKLHNPSNGLYHFFSVSSALNPAGFCMPMKKALTGIFVPMEALPQ
jgi:hypothetical protein